MVVKGISVRGQIKLTLGLLSLTFLTLGFTGLKPFVIYGDDNRQDVYAVSSQALKTVADSTVAMIPNAALRSSAGSSNLTVLSATYGESYGLCSTEPFVDQPNAAMCSGFLVGEDLIATAGHCISDSECSENSFVFGYEMKDEATAPIQVPASEVYKCKQVIAREQTEGQDYALVQLDRPVKNHQILSLSTHPAQVNDPVIVVGHPAGLPTKIAGGAFVREVQDTFFVSNTDTYGGNSGSAIFNANTLEVVGILVRGEQDFERNVRDACNRSKKCSDTACRGEDSTQIKFISNLLPR